MEMLYIILSLISIILGTIVIYLYNKFVRPRFSSKVTCWFCGTKAKVPYGNRNCWDCPDCEQYNGFDKDGGYNKAIPAQFDERLNHPVKCDVDEYIGGHSVLCERCTQNNLLKVKQLANFVPYNEKNYEYEVEAFERHLEKVYRPCLACEIKVQQELQIQNEALSRRLHNQEEIDRSFMQQNTEEQTFLHSSYTDKRKNSYITASVVLHLFSFLCGMALLIRNATIDRQNVLHYLTYIYPVLVWLDKQADVAAVLGLSTGVLAKLCLGKYRLHIIDAISCPVWLLVLLLQIGYIPVHETGSLYGVISGVTNTLTCAVCLGLNRRRRNQSDMSMTRLSLDDTDSCSVSSISPYSSVSQIGSNTPENTSYRSLGAEVQNNCRSDQSIDDNDAGIGRHGHHETLEAAASEFDAISLGEPPLRRTESGIFSNVSQSSFISNLNNQSVSEGLRYRSLGQSRPLISAAAFSHTSNPDRHRSSSVPRHGLFSTPSTDSSPLSFLDRPSSPTRVSAFTHTSLFSADRHSFTPERPTTPVVTSFGMTPFTNLPSSDRLSSLSSFSVARHQGSVAKQHTSVQKSKERTDDTIDRDTVSDFTSVTSRCRVDSTTGSGIQEQQKVPFWRHPGLIGFILGGSVVANVLLAAQMTWFSKS